MKEQLIRKEKALKKYGLIFLVILVGGILGYWYNVTSKPAYLAAIEAIKNSEEVLAEVRIVESFGLLPVVNFVPNKETTAEYVITVFGEKDSEYGDTDRNVQIVLEQSPADTWEVTYLSIGFVGQSSGGDDLLILVALSSGVVSLIFLFLLSSAYSKKRKLLLDPNTRISKGYIVDVASRIVQHTMPGNSNYGVERTDFDNRSVVHKTEMFVPAVDFIDQNGTTIHLEHKFSSSKNYKKGDEIVVIYHTEAPNDAQLKDFFWFWVHFHRAFFVALGVIALGSGLLIMTL